jgi:hypothetical protein
MNEARDTLLDTIYNNPLPTAVTGFGLIWLLMNRSRAASNRARGSNGSNGQGATVGRVVQQATGAVAQGVQGATHAAGDALDGASDLVTSITQTASEGVQQAAHTVSDGALSLAGTAQESAKRVERTVQRALQDRPLAVGAAALAIGTMVGCSLPRTTAEDELMGETRDDVLARAGNALHDAAASVAKTSETERTDSSPSSRAGQGGRHENVPASRPAS